MVSDSNEILEVLSRHNVSYDENRIDDQAECFAPDAYLRILVAGVPEATEVRGRDAIRDYMADSRAARTTQPRHFQGNVAMTALGNGQVKVDSYALVMQVGEQLDVVSVGRCEDKLERLDNRWVITNRTMKMDIPYKDPEQ